jgi:hypothetical protein
MAMRCVFIRCLNESLRIELGSDVGIIAKVIEIGRCRDFLIYEARLNGKELLEFLDEFNLRSKYEHLINSAYNYEIVAYDD